MDEGELVTLVGVSGAGKSTLLRVIADLIPPHEGSIKVDAVEDSTRRPISMVFQAPLLMPWRKISDNIALGLEGIDVPKALRDERVRHTLDLVGLADYGERWPYQLSGGQRQRIGIARALAVDPDILLMDEPFAALDEITRFKLNNDVLELWAEFGLTVVFVTHSVFESVFLSDRIVIEGIKFHGYHGLTRMERQVGVRLSVDVSVELDLDASGRSDKVKDTLDYRKIHECVVEIGRGSSHRLLESYAVAVLDELFKKVPAEAITIRVRKETPVLDGIVDAVGVELSRLRPSGGAK